MKSYINNQGKKVIIREMPDPYLLNSYYYCRKRIRVLKKATKSLPKNEVKIYIEDTENREQSLLTEIKRRKLTIKPT